MLIHRENALKRPSLSLYKEITKKKFLVQNLIINIHQEARNCTYFQNILAGEYAP